MRLCTGIGIAALVIAILGIFIPLVGLFVGWIALAVACIAALCGDKGLTIATVIVSVVAFVFFTPSLWLDYLGYEADIATVGGTYSPILIPITIVMLIAPVVSIILFSTGRLALTKNAKSEIAKSGDHV